MPAKHNIPQPLLRPIRADERIVRTADLKFILTGRFLPGQTLSAEDAEFCNTAWHTAILNRFKATLEVLLEDPRCNYEFIDEALRDFAHEFKWRARPHKPPEESLDPDQIEFFKELTTWARPKFQALLPKGHGMSRKEYEASLKSWVEQNSEELTTIREAEIEADKKLALALARRGE